MAGDAIHLDALYPAIAAIAVAGLGVWGNRRGRRDSGGDPSGEDVNVIASIAELAAEAHEEAEKQRKRADRAEAQAAVERARAEACEQRERQQP